MYYRKDGQRLKTKIIATVGSEARELFDPNGNKYDIKTYGELFQWFVQPNHDCLMVDVLRLNMAFYSRKKIEDPYKRIFEWLKQEKDGLGRNVGVLCDLGGAKPRLGQFKGQNGKVKVEGNFQLDLKNNIEGDKDKASVLAYGEPFERLTDYDAILGRLQDSCGPGKPGIVISVGDGQTTLRAIELKDDILYCKVEKEGTVKSNWGITFEEIDLGLPSFQRPDQDALKFLLDLDNKQGFLSFIGVSFVREAEDIIKVRRFVEHTLDEKWRYDPIDARLCCPNIIAKIETKRGARNIKAILDVADGAMVARGDLALQLSREEVPQIQKEIINLCNKRGKIVITATEMLASMEDSPKPTRAEVNDVFNSIMDGTDAVMLSGETSSGKYPAQSVDYMNRIAEKAETYYETIYARRSTLNTERIQALRQGSEALIQETIDRLEEKIREYEENKLDKEANLYREILEKIKDQGTTDRICAAACELAEEKEFETIIASTASGRTVRMLSRFRPSVKLVGVVYDERCRRKLLLSYGAYPLSIGETSPATGSAWNNPDGVFKKAAEDCVKEGSCQIGDHAIFVSGTPLGKYGQGKVNILQIKDIPVTASSIATAQFAMLTVTVKKGTVDQVLSVARKLKKQAKEHGVELTMQWKETSPVELIITIVEVIERNAMLSALIWALIVGFLAEIGKHIINRRKNLQMATIQAWHYLKENAKVNVNNLTLEKCEQRVGGNFWFVFRGDGVRHQITISEGCQVKKYKTK
jgi:pyruvate kinase